MICQRILLHRFYADLMDSKINNINLSVDSLIPEKFAFITRQDKRSADKVFENLNKILLPNVGKLKLNRMYANFE